MSQQQLADALNINRSTYARYELGQTQPDFETLEKIASFFDVSIDYLIKGEDTTNNSVKSNLPEHKNDSLAEINKLIKEYGIEQIGFFDIDKWKNLSKDDIDEIRRHFEWVAQKAKERNDEKPSD
ncbi:transcriptional repressor of PBSX gene [Heyndrickxia coagulans]|uniref:XRE family transcriptional regulator n=1 Tax=Heyndrickxia coagulans TaxID=1398 RepID=A0AAN0T6D2_HEYCO|nr:XRE family transcriptional regulator [Heyndrickxia coagulans]AKN55632.1 transcriptional repressor of PBSX gene [Heyndrickxia coagulans]